MNTINTNLNQVIMKALKYIALCAVYSNTIIMHTLSVVAMYVHVHVHICMYICWGRIYNQACFKAVRRL